MVPAQQETCFSQAGSCSVVSALAFDPSRGEESRAFPPTPRDPDCTPPVRSRLNIRSDTGYGRNVWLPDIPQSRLVARVEQLFTIFSIVIS